MKKNIISTIENKGYVKVEETNTAVSFVNESAQYCVILIDVYLDYHENDEFHDLIFGMHTTLKQKYSFAEKCTICVYIDTPLDNDVVKRNPYHFLKVTSDELDVLPTIVNKDITVNILPAESMEDQGDYFINPFQKCDGICNAEFLRFISNIKTDVIVKYPLFISNSEIRWFHYVSNKMYKVNFVS